MQSFEGLRNRLPLIDHRVVIDAQRRNLADALTQRSLNRVLVQSLRLSPGEAAPRASTLRKLSVSESRRSVSHWI